MTERILELVFRHKFLLSLPIILGLAGGIFALSKAKEPYFASRAAIWVEKPTDLSGGSFTEFNPYASPADNQASSMRELLGLNSFTSDVIERAYSKTRLALMAQELRANTFIYPFGTHVLYVEHRSPDAVLAKETVSAVVDAYGALYTTQIKARAERSRLFYEEQLKASRKALEQAGTELRGYLVGKPQFTNVDLSNPPSNALRDVEFARLVAAEQNARENFEQMLEKYADSQISANTLDGAIPNFLIMDEPQVPSARISPSKRALLMPPALGLASGVFISSVGFLVYWRLDRRVHMLDDLSFLDPRIPVMTVPWVGAKRRKWPPRFVRVATALRNGLRPGYLLE